MDRALAAPTLEQVRAAHHRIRGAAIRTPAPVITIEGRDYLLKLENLQPIGSFKLRGAVNAIRAASREVLEHGVYTASAGNMAQGVAWAARSAGIAAVAVVPNTAPRAKLDAIERLGGRAELVAPDEWWAAMSNHGHPGLHGLFVHPFADPLVMAGNGTIALELLDVAPDIDAIFVPWGGGGLACGIASVVRAVKPGVRVIACEVEGAAPLAEAGRRGAPEPIRNRRTFVDGIGGPTVFAEMWPLSQHLIDATLTVGPDDVAEAVRLIARHTHSIAEGAGAVALAAAIRYSAVLQPAVTRPACIVSGGNVDAGILSRILGGETPA